jgi:hypothetical protein
MESVESGGRGSSDTLGGAGGTAGGTAGGGVVGWLGGAFWVDTEQVRRHLKGVWS